MTDEAEALFLTALIDQATVRLAEVTRKIEARGPAKVLLTEGIAEVVQPKFAARWSAEDEQEFVRRIGADECVGQRLLNRFLPPPTVKVNKGTTEEVKAILAASPERTAADELKLLLHVLGDIAEAQHARFEVKPPTAKFSPSEAVAELAEGHLLMLLADVTQELTIPDRVTPAPVTDERMLEIG